MSYKLLFNYYLNIHVYFKILNCKAKVANIDI